MGNRGGTSVPPLPFLLLLAIDKFCTQKGRDFGLALFFLSGVWPGEYAKSIGNACYNFA